MQVLGTCGALLTSKLNSHQNQQPRPLSRPSSRPPSLPLTPLSPSPSCAGPGRGPSPPAPSCPPPAPHPPPRTPAAPAGSAQAPGRVWRQRQQHLYECSDISESHSLEACWLVLHAATEQVRGAEGVYVDMVPPVHANYLPACTWAAVLSHMCRRQTAASKLTCGLWCGWPSFLGTW